MIQVTIPTATPCAIFRLVDGKRYNALEDICDTIGILALDTALIDTVHAGSIRIQIEKKCIIWGSPDKNTRNYDSGWSL